jgi:type VI secretion system secreted protein VgrG
MSKLVTTNIFIGDTEVKQFSQFSLGQGIFEHHSFRLVCPAEALDGTKGALFSKSKNFIGATITVTIKEYEGKNNTPIYFSGIVTEVNAVKYAGYVGDVIVSGFSPTIVLDDGPDFNTWEKKAVKNIITDVFSNYPQNILNPQIKPIYSETLAYTVQYRETAWNFCNRIAATYGEWFYYDGKSTLLGMPKSKEVALIYGGNLSEFSMTLQTRPNSFKNVAFDYLNNQVITSTPEGIANKAGLNDMGNFLQKKSLQTFANTPQNYTPLFITNKKQLDDQTNIRSAAQSSNMVKANGSSSHLGVQLGNVLKINEGFGDHTVIKVTHHCDGQGNYSNDFVGIPASIKVPPVTNYTEPNCETQSAIVTDNYDVKGLGRIRVRFHWMASSQKTPWIRVASMHGGGNKGSFFMPEVGEEVVVAFEGGSAIKPYVTSTVYNGGESTGFANAGNDLKVIQTRSGTKIRMNDAEGSVFVEDPSGNTWHMDGNGNISVTAPQNFTVNAGANIFLNAGLNISEIAGVNKSTHIGMMLNTKVGANHTLTVGGDSIEHITGNYSAESQERDETAKKIVKSSTDDNIHLHAKATVNLNSDEKGLNS